MAKRAPKKIVRGEAAVRARRQERLEATIVSGLARLNEMDRNTKKILDVLRAGKDTYDMETIREGVQEMYEEWKQWMGQSLVRTVAPKGPCACYDYDGGGTCYLRNRREHFWRLKKNCKRPTLTLY
jgi:hypothetical protein